MRRRGEWCGISSGNIFEISTWTINDKSHIIVVFYEDIRRIDVAKDVSVCRTEFSFSYTTYPIL
jgi:hypothetical protein